MLVELAYRARCRCGQDAEAALATALAKLGIERALIRRTVIDHDHDAPRAGLAGCPTLRVNGLDVQLRYRWDRNYRATCRTAEGAAPPAAADIIRTIKKTACTRVGCC